MENEMRFNTPKITPPDPLSQQERKVTEKSRFKFRFKFNIKQQHLLIGAGIAVVLLAIAAAAFFYIKAEELKRQSVITAQDETARVIEEVGKLIILPENEEPTVATISDVEKLKGQPFFEDAKDGDKVLIYAKAGKAILYDPVKKIIVEVAPLNVTK